ncbi:hypothetical protein R1flu_011166 [Riccia fluitans]|uniref:Beta-carotene isomerase D27-like C-terminal domain-containing protein n=1 Tax=Riccia fluitans TaxID=41844 RepID=A0ABD1Z9J2_9MARC
MTGIKLAHPLQSLVVGVVALSCFYILRTRTLLSRVYVHKCKYLEKSKCAGICTHTCKIPTQSFLKEYMAILLAMESNIKENIKDFNCQG